MGTKVESKFATLWLAGLFFIEAFCFIIPVDPLLILFCVENQAKSFYYATIATISSVLGGVFGYLIGYCLWDSIGIKVVTFIISAEVFEAAKLKYQLYQNWAVLIAGFSPLPYKAVTLSAGFCHFSLSSFIFFSVLARGARFFLVALIIKLFGPSIKIFIDRYFNQLVILFTLLVIFCVWLVK
jgi:membrane protein YqaA with SNARE-associated domain